MSDSSIPPTATLENLPETEGASGGPRRMVLNMGPQHPSTHGVLRLLLELDGETLTSCKPDIGYLHTGIEKEFEVKTYQQAVTLTDRVDYLAPLSNNLGYCLAVEKLLGLEIPPAAQWMRVMLTELTRLNSHPPAAEIERAFDLAEQLKHVDHIFDRVFLSTSNAEPAETARK